MLWGRTEGGVDKNRYLQSMSMRAIGTLRPGTQTECIADVLVGYDISVLFIFSGESDWSYYSRAGDQVFYDAGTGRSAIVSSQAEASESLCGAVTEDLLLKARIELIVGECAKPDSDCGFTKERTVPEIRKPKIRKFINRSIGVRG
jgi:hypothetical protein